MKNRAMEQKRKLIDAGLATDDSFVGCSEEEIELLEKRDTIKFPQSFKDFLLVMGKRRGDFYAECACSYPFDDLRRIAVDLLKDVNETLADSAFVFLERYGCAVLYFDTKCGEDPPVYICQEDEEPPAKIADSFSEWLNMAVDAHIAGCLKFQKL